MRVDIAYLLTVSVYDALKVQLLHNAKGHRIRLDRGDVNRDEVITLICEPMTTISQGLVRGCSLVVPRSARNEQFWDY